MHADSDELELERLKDEHTTMWNALQRIKASRDRPHNGHEMGSVIAIAIYAIDLIEHARGANKMDTNPRPRIKLTRVGPGHYAYTSRWEMIRYDHPVTPWLLTDRQTGSRKRFPNLTSIRAYIQAKEPPIGPDGD